MRLTPFSPPLFDPVHGSKNLKAGLAARIARDAGVSVSVPGSGYSARGIRATRIGYADGFQPSGTVAGAEWSGTGVAGGPP